MTDTPITDMMTQFGLPPDRLRAVLDQSDNWGSMVHAFEYLTACGVLLNLATQETQLLEETT